MVIDELEQEPVYDWMPLINIFLETSLHRTKTLKLSALLGKSKQHHIINGILFR
jgi:hypothetical protein